MKKFISTFLGHGDISTALAAQKMVATLAKEEGYEEIKIYPHNCQEESEEVTLKRISYALESVVENSMFVLQLPTWNMDLHYERKFFYELRKKVKHLVIFVHDFIPLMFESNLGYTEFMIEYYNKADLVILPSQKMNLWLQEYGLKVPVVIQEFWDHYTTLPLAPPEHFNRRVQFPGSPDKFQITKSWPQDVALDIYASQAKEGLSPNIKFHSFLPDHSLLLELNNGGFGLVWAENTENMPTKDYYTMCHPYKISTYLAAGLPLLIQSGCTDSEFVARNGIGVVVESLEEAAQVVRNISEDEYLEMVKRLAPISQMIREGFFCKKLLIQIEEALFIKKEES